MARSSDPPKSSRTMTTERNWALSRDQHSNGPPAIIGKPLLLLTPVPIVADTFNGALIRRPGFSGLSKGIKTGHLCLLAIYAAHSRSGVVTLCLCIITNATFLLVRAIPAGSASSIMADAQWLLRFNILWIGYHAFRRMTQSGVIDSRWIIRCLSLVSLILFTNLILGTLGPSYSQYGKYTDSEQIGAIGFIYASDEMSFLILLCQAVACGLIYHQKRKHTQ